MFAPTNPRPTRPTTSAADSRSPRSTSSTTSRRSTRRRRRDSGPCGPSGTLDCRGADSVGRARPPAGQDGRRHRRPRRRRRRARRDAERRRHGGRATSSPRSTPAPGAGRTLFDTGFIGTDAIKVAFIYRPATVDAGRRLRHPRLVRRPALHRHPQPAGADPDVRGGRHRRAVHGRDQPPQVEGLGVRRLGDPDRLDGQGNCPAPAPRPRAALADHLAALDAAAATPTSSSSATSTRTAARTRSRRSRPPATST